jgi:hypothetical protein
MSTTNSASCTYSRTREPRSLSNDGGNIANSLDLEYGHQLFLKVQWDNAGNSLPSFLGRRDKAIGISGVHEWVAFVN